MKKFKKSTNWLRLNEVLPPLISPGGSGCVPEWINRVIGGLASGFLPAWHACVTVRLNHIHKCVVTLVLHPDGGRRTLSPPGQQERAPNWRREEHVEHCPRPWGTAYEKLYMSYLCLPVCSSCPVVHCTALASKRRRNWGVHVVTWSIILGTLNYTKRACGGLELLVVVVTQSQTGLVMTIWHQHRYNEQVGWPGTTMCLKDIHFYLCKNVPLRLIKTQKTWWRFRRTAWRT